MTLIGITEAARRLGVAHNAQARHILTAAGVPLVTASERAYLVDDSDVDRVAAARVKRGPGRPKGTKNKMAKEGKK